MISLKVTALTYTTLFGIIVALMVIDENVSEYILLKMAEASLNVRRFLFIVKFKITMDNPIAKRLIYYKYLRMAEDLQKRMEKNRDTGNESDD